jgi:phosphoglycerate kinase
VRSLSDLHVEGSVVALRCDFNVPLDGQGEITDDLRIQAAIPTILALTARQAKVVILAHLGRPKGQVVASMSLAPVARRLSELLGKPVEFMTNTEPSVVRQQVNLLEPGSVALLENVRFDPRETSKDSADRAALASEWAQWAQFFVSDGFGVVHRSQASVTELAELIPNAAGLLVEKESQVFDTLLHNADKPYTVVLGGSKVSDKLGVIDSLLPRVNNLLIGGGMAYTFLLAKGLSVGSSLQEPDFVPTVLEFMRKAKDLGVNLMLPVDFVVAQEFAPDSVTQVVDAQHIPDNWMGLDIGPVTREKFAAVIDQSKTVVWNGPMGVFEMPAFSAGTLAVAQAMAQSGAFTVIGGGDSAAAVRLLNVDPTKFDHISTGGGASLEFLEGKSLPGLAVLEGS